MSPERWLRLEQLFDQAVTRPPEERAAFLRNACPDDSELCAEVEAMIQREHAGTWVASAVGAAAEAAAAGDIEQGHLVGAYRLEKRIGEGGMGTVWLAHRTEGAFEQTVAIKLIRGGFDSDEAQARFAHERQVLAKLIHPNIARLYDGGVTPNGQQYFVMEFVPGESITQFASERSLPTKARLELFRQVCLAVQHSHRNLVVHRDLKPSNILVTSDGTVKLLDFGIAKPLDAASQENQTQTAFRALTPDYASPEQFLGEPITTASDVYSLGAVLFELLTGAKPHAIDDASPWTAAQVVCTQPVRKPSTVAPDRGVARELRNDLDNIILKAMRREPERRYESAAQLWDDIERYLNNQPVTARPETWGYVASKFVRRHRWGVAAAALVCLSLVAGIASTVRQARIAARRFDQVRALANSLVFEVHDEIQTIPGGTKARALVLRRGLEYLDALTREAHGDKTLLAEIAAGYMRVGDVQGDPFNSNLGEPKQALASYRKAVSIFDGLGERSRLDPKLRGGYALALLKSGVAERYLNNSDGSKTALQKTLTLLNGVTTYDDRLLLARAHYHLGRTLNVSGDLEGAIEETRKSVTLVKNLDAERRSSQTVDLLGTASNALGEGLARTERFDEAVEQYGMVLKLREEALRNRPLDTPARRNVMLAHANLGDVLGSPTRPSLGKVDAAIPHYMAAVEVAEKGVAADAHDRRARTDLSYGLMRLGSALHAQGNPEALHILRRSLAITDGLVEQGAASGNLLLNASFLEERIGAELTRQKKFADALPHFARAVALVAPDNGDRKAPADSVRYALAARSGWMKALARLGRTRETLDQIAKAKPLADAIPSLAATDARRLAARPRAYVDFAEALSMLAERQQGELARRAVLKDSCEWIRQGAAIWKELQGGGKIVESLRNEPALAASKAASCRW